MICYAATCTLLRCYSPGYAPTKMRYAPTGAALQPPTRLPHAHVISAMLCYAATGLARLLLTALGYAATRTLV
eukprot:2432148-Rhodomonas_salina.1